MTRIEVKVLCAERKACPDVIEQMTALGFDGIKEVFDKVDADIIATLEVEDDKDSNQKLHQLFEKTGEKISQISYKM